MAALCVRDDLDPGAEEIAVPLDVVREESGRRAGILEGRVRGLDSTADAITTRLKRARSSGEIARSQAHGAETRRRAERYRVAETFVFGCKERGIEGQVVRDRDSAAKKRLQLSSNLIECGSRVDVRSGQTVNLSRADIPLGIEHVTDADTWTQSCSYAATP